MTDPSLTPTEQGCLKCLTYFGIFLHPLTTTEVNRFSEVASTMKDTETALRNLVSRGQVFKMENYYALADDSEVVRMREEGMKRAVELLNRSGKYVRFITRAPFVRGIAISGSLSKFYAPPAADIDYFIITEADRLWIARTLLHLFKKLTFVTGHQHYFCMNYFVDTNHLTITHPNLYSAIETVTVLPVYNKELIADFIRHNRWTMEYLPNEKTVLNTEFLVKSRPYPVKQLIEKLMDRLAPQRLNRWLMTLTDRKWRRKWKGHGYSEGEYNKAFQTETGISKNHPADFQRNVLVKLNDYEY